MKRFEALLLSDTWFITRSFIHLYVAAPSPGEVNVMQQSWQTYVC